MKRLITVLATAFILTACGGSENSDGSKKSTYSSCSITKSEALLAGDRANDLKQCWDGVSYKEQNLAMKWC